MEPAVKAAAYHLTTIIANCAPRSSSSTYAAEYSISCDRNTVNNGSSQPTSSGMSWCCALTLRMEFCRALALPHPRQHLTPEKSQISAATFAARYPTKLTVNGAEPLSHCVNCLWNRGASLVFNDEPLWLHTISVYLKRRYQKASQVSLDCPKLVMLCETWTIEWNLWGFVMPTHQIQQQSCIVKRLIIEDKRSTTVSQAIPHSVSW